MIPTPSNPNPIPNVSLQSLFIFRFILLWLFFSSLYLNLTPVALMKPENRLARKRSSVNQTHMFGLGVQQGSKKLRRLPHVFSRVLELPVKSDANVSVEVSSKCFRFVVGVAESVNLCGEGSRVEARVVNLYPGVVKVVVTGYEEGGLGMDAMELDRWRFRLPVTTRPDRAIAACVDGELVVTVPKDLSVVDEDGVEAWSGIELLVEVV